MPNGQCGPEFMQMQRRGLVINRVQYGYAHKQDSFTVTRCEIFSCKCSKIDSAAELRPDPLGKLTYTELPPT